MFKFQLVFFILIIILIVSSFIDKIDGKCIQNDSTTEMLNQFRNETDIIIITKPESFLTNLSTFVHHSGNYPADFMPFYVILFFGFF